MEPQKCPRSGCSAIPMRFNVALFAFARFPLAAQQAVSKVLFSEAEELVPAFSTTGATTLPAVHLHLDISYPAGKKERGDLVVVYDPEWG